MRGGRDGHPHLILELVGGARHGHLGAGLGEGQARGASGRGSKNRVKGDDAKYSIRNDGYLDYVGNIGS